MKTLLLFLAIALSINSFGQVTAQSSVNADLYLNGILTDGQSTLSRTEENRITLESENTYYDFFGISCLGCLIQEMETYYLITIRRRSKAAVANIRVFGVKGKREINLYQQSFRIE